MLSIKIIEQLDMDFQKLAQKTFPDCLEDAFIKHFYQRGKRDREWDETFVKLCDRAHVRKV